MRSFSANAVLLESSVLLSASSARESVASTVSSNPLDSIDNGVSPSTSALQDCVALLERSQQNLLHLGRIADIQTLRHGLPSPQLIPTPLQKGTSTISSNPAALDPRNELLHSFALALSAYHMTPPGTLSPSEFFLPLSTPSTTITATASGQAYKSTGQSKASLFADDVKEEPHSGSSKRTKVKPHAEVEPSEAISRAPKATGKEKSESTDANLLPLSRTDVAMKGSNGSTRLQEDESAEPISSTPAAMTTLLDAGPAKSRSKWAPAEIALFEEGIRLHGEHNPKLISEHMRGCRSNEQVRERIKSIKRSLGLQKKYVPPAQTNS